MAICPNCGKEVQESMKFCIHCGALLPESKQQNQSGQSGASPKDNVWRKFMDTPDITDECDPADISRNTGLALLSYLSVLVLIPIFAGGESRFVRFHANQGLILLIASVLVGALRFVPFLGWILSRIGQLAVLGYMILGIVNVVRGRARELPLIGQFVLIQ